MVENTKIEWATHTLNWWTGCEHVSPACAHCYAEAWAKRAGRDFAERRLTSQTIHNLPYKWERAARATGDRPHVFVNSLSDFFDNKVPDEWRSSFFEVAGACPRVTFMLLTKRIGNAARMLPADAATVFPNVWVGATVVTQEEADRDIPKLLRVNAAIRFLSIEPMLAPINLDSWPESGCGRNWLDGEPSIDWVIAGGESGPRARPVNPNWIRSLRDQCEANYVDFFFKQWGEWGTEIDPPVHDSFRWPVTETDPPGGLWSYRVGKERAGAMLDGRLHRARPPHHAC